ncbi:gibberellin-regulated protein 11-like [Eucalyptus grandis]|uniref:gibberellin-regulated protein 11-like n=1 Tax=Eucalyptus grandis TaxID=71139 RepID=UPI00192E77C5|nr:gibberellin-regulated protein 11-like [Eucalyptus grandis]
MALSRLCMALLLLSLLLIHQAESDYMVIQLNTAEAPPPPPPHIDCDGACDARCQLSSRPHLCKRACGTCCARCNCVPPGTSGNYDACPCYANMTTRGSRHKCP